MWSAFEVPICCVCGCGASPEFLIELHQPTTLTLRFTITNLWNGHTERTSAKTVTPNSLLAEELDVSMPGMDGNVELNFSSFVDEGTKTETPWTGSGTISGKL